MKRWGIKVRILLVALTPALAIALLLGFYFAQVRFADLERSLNERGLAIARQLAAASEYGVFSGNREVLSRLAVAVTREADVIGVTIRDFDGNVLASQGTAVMPAVPNDTASVPTQHESDGGRMLILSALIIQSQLALEEFFETDRADGSRVRHRPPVRVLGRVYVAISRTTLIGQRRRLILDTVVITLLILAGSAFLAIRMGRGVTRPVVVLTDVVRKLADGDLDTRVTPDSGGAIRALEDGVNIMARALKSAHTDLENRIVEATVELAKKRDEAERANAAKSRFLAAASHDLRQPLHALGLYVTALRDRRFGDDTRRVVGQIVKSVSMMQDLLEVLLDISRLDAGAVTPNIADFPVTTLFAMLETSYAPTARAKGIALHVVPCRANLRSDPVLLGRILFNFVSNAVRYTQKGKVLVGCRRRGDNLRIEVWDTGCGIPEDQQSLIFEEFHRVADPEHGSEKGIGLGLAIVDRLAKLLGHVIEVRSTPGRGSMFAVTVPRATENPEVSPEVMTARSGIRLENALVLVIDDDPAALEATQTLLESWGCRVLTATSGAEAEAYLSAQRGQLPVIIVCDYHLAEGETGIQVLNRLRALRTDHMQGVLVTGDTSTEITRAVQDSGYPLLQKPVRPAKLRALLNHYLRAHGPSSRRDR